MPENHRFSLYDIAINSFIEVEKKINQSLEHFKNIDCNASFETLQALWTRLQQIKNPYQDQDIDKELLLLFLPTEKNILVHQIIALRNAVISLNAPDIDIDQGRTYFIYLKELQKNCESYNQSVPNGRIDFQLVDLAFLHSIEKNILEKQIIALDGAVTNLKASEKDIDQCLTYFIYLKELQKNCEVYNQKEKENQEKCSDYNKNKQGALLDLELLPTIFDKIKMVSSHSVNKRLSFFYEPKQIDRIQELDENVALLIKLYLTYKEDKEKLNSYQYITNYYIKEYHALKNAFNLTPEMLLSIDNNLTKLKILSLFSGSDEEKEIFLNDLFLKILITLKENKNINIDKVLYTEQLQLFQELPLNELCKQKIALYLSHLTLDAEPIKVCILQEEFNALIKAYKSDGSHRQELKQRANLLYEKVRLKYTEQINICEVSTLKNLNSKLKLMIMDDKQRENVLNDDISSIPDKNPNVQESAFNIAYLELAILLTPENTELHTKLTDKLALLNNAIPQWDKELALPKDRSNPFFNIADTSYVRAFSSAEMLAGAMVIAVAASFLLIPGAGFLLLTIPVLLTIGLGLFCAGATHALISDIAHDINMEDKQSNNSLSL